MAKDAFRKFKSFANTWRFWALILAVPLTLLVIPVVYSLLDRKVYAVDRAKAPRQAMQAATAASGVAQPQPQAVPLMSGGAETVR